MPPLKRAITFSLLFKLAALTLLWLLFFRPALRPHPDSEAVDTHLFAAPVSSATLPPGDTADGS